MPNAPIPVRIVTGLTALNEVGGVVDVLPVRATTDLVAVNEVGRPIDVPLATVETGLIATNEVGGAVSVTPVRIVTDAFVPDAAGRLVFAQPLRGLAVNNPPVNTALPVITQTGSVLSVTTGTWTGTAPISYAYQWSRNGTPISGATAATYTIPDADLNALFGCIVTGTNSAGNASAAAALLYVGVMDVLSVAPAANYELRRESRSYTGNAIRVRRSSDNAEANFGFATAAQTRTNLAAIPINNNAGSTTTGVTMTVTGTGTEFGQPYVEVRWQGTATINGFIQFVHSATAAFNPAIHAPVTPGLTYTASVGFRLVSGTAPSGTPTMRGLQIASGGGLITGGAGNNMGALSSELRRGAVIVVAAANAAYIQPNIFMSVNNGEVVNCTIRFYTANVELGIGNARPLLQRNVPETVAAIGELDAEALLAFVGNGNGFITILHDKSGNARNATQTTPANQPRIVGNGAVITVNGVPSIDYTGITQGNLSVAGGFAIQAVSVFAKNNLANAISFDGLLGGNVQHILNAVQGSSSLGIGTTLTDFIAYRNGLTTSPNGNYINLSLPFIATVNYNTAATNSAYTIGLIFGGNRVWNGQISEMILFSSTLSTTDRKLLERNRGAYYGIPIA